MNAEGRCSLSRYCELREAAGLAPSALRPSPCDGCPLTPVSVIVTGHAIDRAAKRSSLAGWKGQIRNEVRDALAAGRTSKRRPRWVGGSTGAPPDHVFAWSSCCTRCYLVKKDTDGAF